MPSARSIAQNARDMTRSRSRTAIGVGAASVAAVGSLIGVAASTGPAVSLAAYHGRVLASAAAVSQAVHISGAATGQHAAAPAPLSSPHVASAPSQQAPAASTLVAASAQVAAAPSQQQAPAASTLAAASPQVAAAPAEVQAHAGATGAPGRSKSPGAHSVATSAQPVGAPAAQPASAPAQSDGASASAAASPAPQPAPQPYQIYDSVTPSALPSSSQAVAVYADGNYAAAPSQVGQRGLVLWIDTNGSDTRADVLDVEPGDATPAQAAMWVAQKLDASPNSVAIVYTMRSDWGAVQAAVNALPWWMPSHTRYWIADPTGVPHIVPGSQATQWYWGQNYDISTALPNF
jgi:hypothetical protein